MRSHNKKAIVLLVLGLSTGCILKAQSYNTNEKLSTQLKNGTAPGLRFTPTKPEKAPADKITPLQKRESSVSLIRKGIAPNMKFQSGGSAVRTATPVAATNATAAKQQGPFASEMEAPKVENKKIPVVAIPSQEEQKQ